MTENELTKYYEELLELASRAFRPDEAEILVSDTILTTLEDIRSGKVIENPSGYLRRVLNCRKNDYLREKYRDQVVTYDGGEILSRLPERKSIDRSGEEYLRVRRELSRLNEIYREVMVRHYMNGEKVADIATALKLPVGTVKRRLGSGRELVRERLVMDAKMNVTEEKYSNLSYAPKRLHIGIWGCGGTNGSPFTLVGSSLIAQNVLITAYERPITAARISDMLGIPTAYIEHELERLVSGELMGKTSGGLYFTRAFLVKNGEQYGDIEAQRAAAATLVEPIWRLIRERLEAQCDLPVCRQLSDKQKAILALHFLMKAGMIGRYIYNDAELPERPSCGKWLAIGTVLEGSEKEIDDPYRLSGPASTNDGTRMLIDLQSKLGETHWSYLGSLKYPISLPLMRDFLVSFKDKSVKPGDSRIFELIFELERLHILKRNPDGTAVPDVPVIPHAEYMKLLAAYDSLSDKLYELLAPTVKQLCDSLNRELPEHIDCREAFRHYGVTGSFLPELLIAAVNKGLVNAVIGETPIMIATY